MPIPTPEEMRRGFAALPNGVCVLQVELPDCRPGMTVSTVVPLSLQPPLLLTCVRKWSYIGRRLPEVRHFSLIALDKSQAGVSDYFAGSAGAGDSASPELVAGAGLRLDCTRHTAYDGGDHWILVGDIVSLSIGVNTAPPLIHYQGRYWSTAPLSLENRR
jgi:flavin reductase (DIM6/NTAB) family NADH-FMN oxidoreductase RutF